MDKFSSDLATNIAAWPEVTAIALGGSRASGQADKASDVDLYIYVSDDVPLERRCNLIDARGDRTELDNSVWETGDEWINETTGIAVDMTCRTQPWLEEELAKVLYRNEASLGYTTGFLYNVQISVVLFDRNGWYQRLQEKALQPYPGGLAKAIIAKNLPSFARPRARFPSSC